jgi:2-phospho-L-lactate guanylyltransferase (CobY/MobA/RfbA family)
MDDEMRKEVLGEVLLDELKAIREYVSDIPAIKRGVAILTDDVEEIKTDIKAIKSVVKDYSRQLDEREKEIQQLKHKTA